MCEYCAYNKDFWNQVTERAKDIRVLTSEEVEQLYRDNPQLRPEAAEHEREH
jgi:hypothetical protein